MYGASFYGCHTAQRQLQVITNKNIIMSSFKSSRNIQKKECGPDKFKLNVSLLIIWPDEGTQAKIHGVSARIQSLFEINPFCT